MRLWPGVLTVTGGTVETVSPDGAGVRAFKGLPYAAPPVGVRRWRAPAPVVPWNGIRPTGGYGPNCPQPSLVASIDAAVHGMAEDCLTLNVWTPAATPDERLPVVVWIHGGAFLVGMGTMQRADGAALVHEGVVLVAMNYRLGAFGFLSHPELTAEGGASGNYGIMDQIAALEWVRDNIAAFGGDPDRVTIMGHSSGGTSVNILMVSPRARGLFHGAIGLGGAAMSANAPSDGSPLPRAVEEVKGKRFAAALGAADLAALRALPAATIVAGGGATIGKWAWNVSIDGDILPETPAALLEAGHQSNVPLLVGWGADEGATMARDSFGGDDRPFAATVAARFGAAAARIAASYPSANLDEDRAAKAALAGDGFIVYPTWIWATTHARTGTAPVFVSQFAFAPQLGPGWSNVVALLGPAGAFHGAQIPYILGTLEHQSTWTLGATDHAISTALVPLFARFIRTGNPGAAAAPWPLYRPDAPEKLRVEPDGTVHVVPDGDFDRLARLGAILADAPAGALRYRGMDADGD